MLMSQCKQPPRSGILYLSESGGCEVPEKISSKRQTGIQVVRNSAPMEPAPQNSPRPWLADSEWLLAELTKTREPIVRIPFRLDNQSDIQSAIAIGFGVSSAPCAIFCTITATASGILRSRPPQLRRTLPKPPRRSFVCAPARDCLFLDTSVAQATPAASRPHCHQPSLLF